MQPWMLPLTSLDQVLPKCNGKAAPPPHPRPHCAPSRKPNNPQKQKATSLTSTDNKPSPACKLADYTGALVCATWLQSPVELKINRGVSSPQGASDVHTVASLHQQQGHRNTTSTEAPVVFFRRPLGGLVIFQCVMVPLIPVKDPSGLRISL